MMLARAFAALFLLSLRRLIWSMNTVMLLLPLGGVALFVLGMHYAELPSTRMSERMFRKSQIRSDEAAEVARLARQVVAGKSSVASLVMADPISAVTNPMRFDRVDKLAARAVEKFSVELVMGLFTSFLLPVIALAYATTSLGGDREERTLLFLLVRPIPRALILLAKTAATLPVVMGVSVGAFSLYCLLAGPLGTRAYPLYLPVVIYTSIAYTGLFQLFAVCFRHSTMIALMYSLFIETFLGNMPGIVKQVAVNYYARSMMIDLGKLSPPESWFIPVSTETATLALAAIGTVSLLAGMIIFQRREYRDLT